MATAVRRTAEQLAAMRKAGRVVAAMHEATRAAAVPGATTAQLDQVARGVLERERARSNFLGYGGFPAVICASPNDVVVHGIPGGHVLAEGDLLSIDCGAIVDGWHGDAAYSMVVGGDDANPAAAALVAAAHRALEAGLAALRDGARVGDVARAVTKVARGRGFAVVEDYVGHGIGLAMHEAPDVPNHWPFDGPNPRLRSGATVAVEPILVAGSHAVETDADGWTVRTVDGSLAAHAEHTVVITPDGVEVLTRA
jgi:methionyl aminopeptidase